MQMGCEYCGGSFSAQRSNRKYCSYNCKQMAYYKRNGLVLSGHSDFVSREPMHGNVKYDSQTGMSEPMLNAIADRLLMLLEARITQRIADKFDLKVKGNVEESAIVKPHFTLNDNQPHIRNQKPLVETSQPANDCIVNDSIPLIVKRSKPLGKQNRLPRHAVEKPIVGISLHDEQSISTKDLAMEENQLAEELERTLLDFTVSDHVNVKDESNGNEDNIIIEELSEPIENTHHDPSENNPTPTIAIESGTVKYERVTSSFIKHIERDLNSIHLDLKECSTPEYKKVLECFKCLIWTLIQLSNRAEVSPEVFYKVAAAFSCLVRSNNFKAVPGYYPFYSLILELKEKLCAAVEAGQVYKVCLSPSRKAMLMAVRCKMGRQINDVKFNQLFL